MVLIGEIVIFIGWAGIFGAVFDLCWCESTKVVLVGVDIFPSDHYYMSVK